MNQRYHDQSYLSHIIEQIRNDSAGADIYFEMIKAIINAAPTFFNRLLGYSAQDKLDVAVKLANHLYAHPNSDQKIELSDKEIKILGDSRLGKWTKPFRHIIEE